MRHIYFRSILTIVWLAAAIISAVSGNILSALFYLAIGGICLYSAYQMWKKGNNHERGN